MRGTCSLRRDGGLQAPLGLRLRLPASSEPWRRSVGWGAERQGAISPAPATGSPVTSIVLRPRGSGSYTVSAPGRVEQPRYRHPRGHGLGLSGLGHMAVQGQSGQLGDACASIAVRTSRTIFLTYLVIPKPLPKVHPLSVSVVSLPSASGSKTST